MKSASKSVSTALLFIKSYVHTVLSLSLSTLEDIREHSTDPSQFHNKVHEFELNDIFSRFYCFNFSDHEMKHNSSWFLFVFFVLLCLLGWQYSTFMLIGLAVPYFLSTREVCASLVKGYSRSVRIVAPKNPLELDHTLINSHLPSPLVFHSHTLLLFILQKSAQ